MFFMTVAFTQLLITTSKRYIQVNITLFRIYFCVGATGIAHGRGALLRRTLRGTYRRADPTRATVLHSYDDSNAER
jgi:hypothetical protein